LYKLNGWFLLQVLDCTTYRPVNIFCFWGFFFAFLFPSGIDFYIGIGLILWASGFIAFLLGSGIGETNWQNISLTVFNRHYHSFYYLAASILT
jgi:hypothetical protein